MATERVLCCPTRNTKTRAGCGRRIAVLNVLAWALFFQTVAAQETTGARIKDPLAGRGGEVDRNRFRFMDHWRIGYMDRNGEVVIKPRFKHAADFENGYAIVWTIERSFVIDGDGRVVLESPHFDVVSYSAELGLFGAKNEQGLYGFVTLAGEIAIPFQFDLALEFSEGRACVRKERKWGLIDPEGKLVLDYRYAVIESFCEGRAMAVAIRPLGTFDQWDNANYEYRRDFIDTSGRDVTPSQYGWALGFQEGLAAVDDGGGCCYIDVSGKKVIAGPFRRAESFHEGLAAVNPIGSELYGFIDKDGKMVIEPQFLQVAHFSSGLCGVIRPNADGEGRQIGCIDRLGDFAITFVEAELDEHFEYGAIFSPRFNPHRHGLAWLRTKTQQGYINRMGGWVFARPIPPVEEFRQVELKELSESSNPVYRLSAAVIAKDEVKVSALLDAHPEAIDGLDHEDRSALSRSVEQESTAVMALLIARRANVNVRDKYRDRTPLHKAVSARRAPPLEIVRSLLGAGANVNARDKDQRTPLHDAVSYGRGDTAALVKLFLDAGADVNAQDAKEFTPLHGIANGDGAVAELLLDAGADPNRRDFRGRTVLWHVVAKTYNERGVALAKLLIEHGAKPDIANNDGQTPRAHVLAELDRGDLLSAERRDAYRKLVDVLTKGVEGQE